MIYQWVIQKRTAKKKSKYLASQDAIEVMSVTEYLIVRTDLTDVTLVSEDNFMEMMKKMKKM